MNCMCFNCLQVTYFVSIYILYTNKCTIFTHSMFWMSLSYCMEPCPVQLVVESGSFCCLQCWPIFLLQTCPLGDTPRAWSQKGMTGIIMPSCWVNVKLVCWADGKLNAPGSFRAPGFLKLFLPIGLRCASPHPVLTYGNTLGTKSAILNQPIPHHIQIPFYNG